MNNTTNELARTEGAGLNPLISFIIPVYNAEKYLRQCLDSVVNQTMRELQIICVNDGSTDGSLAILKEYADKDSRIHTIDKENGGAAAARNAAYPYIKGKYTLFVDSDDWFDLQLCEKVYAEAEQTGADITVFFFHNDGQYKEWGNELFERIPVGLKTTIDEKRTVIPHCLACCKLWRSDFLTQNRITFPEGLIFEDVFINWVGVVLAEKIAIVHERLYYYRVVPSGVMNTASRSAKSIDIIEIYNRVGKFLLDRGYMSAWQDLYQRDRWETWQDWYVHKCPDEVRAKYLMTLWNSLSETDKEFVRNNKLPRRLKRFYLRHFGNVREKMAVALQETISLPERLVRNYVIKPLKRKAA